MYEHMIAAVDASGRAHQVLSATRELAQLSGADVSVVHVLEQGFAGRLGPYDLEDRDEAQKLLDSGVEELRAAGVKAVGSTVTTVAYRAAAAIVDQAKEAGATLIVMGTRGTSNLAGLVIGSVSHKTLHLATCPVLLVRDGPPRYGQILVAIDDSEPARRAVAAASDLARLVKGGVKVVHVFEYPVGRWGGFATERQVEAGQLVEGAVEELRQAGIDASGESLGCPAGFVASEIVAAAERHQIGVTVMGTRGRSDLASLVLGSTTHKVLHLGSTSVLAVP